MGVEKVFWPVLNNPAHTSLQLTQYLICETSVIVFGICAIHDGVRKTSSLLAWWPPFQCAQPPGHAEITSKAK